MYYAHIYIRYMYWVHINIYVYIYNSPVGFVPSPMHCHTLSCTTCKCMVARGALLCTTTHYHALPTLHYFTLPRTSNCALPPTTTHHALVCTNARHYHALLCPTIHYHTLPCTTTRMHSCAVEWQQNECRSSLMGMHGLSAGPINGQC